MMRAAKVAKRAGRKTKYYLKTIFGFLDGLGCCYEFRVWLQESGGGRGGQNEDKFIKIQNSNPKFQTNYNDRNSNLQTSLIKSFGH